jgi:hypothetical protein
MFGFGKTYSRKERRKLEQLFSKLTPEEAAALIVVRDRIAKAPPAEQKALARKLASMLEGRA